MSDVNLPDVVTHLRVDTSGMDRAVSRAAGVGGAIGGLVGGAVGGIVDSAIGKVSEFVSGAVDNFSQLEDATAAAGVVFGDGMQKIITQSETAARTLGLSKAQVIDAANNFGTLGKAAGLTGEPLATFSTDMTELAGNLASFKGGSAQDAVEAVGAAMRGESEPIRRYGVLLDDATLRNRALKLGLIDSVKSALTPQNKTLAAQAEILAQTKDAQGDFARTSNSTANVQKRLEAETANASAALGEKLAPAFTTLRSIGIKAITGLVDGIGAVGPAVDKVKGFVTGALADAGVSFDPAKITAGLAGLGEKVKAAIGPIDFSGMLSGLQEVAGQVMAALAPVATAYQSLFVNGLFPLITTIIGVIRTNVLPVVSSIVGAIREQLGPTLATVSQVMSEKVIPAVQGFAEKVRGAIQSAQPFISLVAKIVGWIVRLAVTILGPVLRALFRFVGFLVSAVFSVLGTLIGWLGKVLGFIGRLPEYIGKGIAKFNEFVGAIRAGISRGISAVTGAVSRFIGAGRALIQGLIDGIKEKISGAVDIVKGGLGKIRDLLPFSPAKTGPFSGRGYTRFSGRALMEGLAAGISDATGGAVDAASRAVGAVSRALGTEDALSATLGSAGPSAGTTARPAMMALTPETLAALAAAVSANVRVYLDGDAMAGKVSAKLGGDAVRLARTGGY